MTNDPLREKLCRAILENKAFLIELILNNPKRKYCCKTCSEYSPLYLSILSNNKQLSQKLIETEDINEVTHLSPLQLAILLYDLDTALLLISKQAKIFNSSSLSTLKLLKDRKGRLKTLILYRYVFSIYYRTLPKCLPVYVNDDLILKIIKYL